MFIAKDSDLISLYANHFFVKAFQVCISFKIIWQIMILKNAGYVEGIFQVKLSRQHLWHICLLQQKISLIHPSLSLSTARNMKLIQEFAFLFFSDDVKGPCFGINCFQSIFVSARWRISHFHLWRPRTERSECMIGQLKHTRH